MWATMTEQFSRGASGAMAKIWERTEIRIYLPLTAGMVIFLIALSFMLPNLVTIFFAWFTGAALLVGGYWWLTEQLSQVEAAAQALESAVSNRQVANLNTNGSSLPSRLAAQVNRASVMLDDARKQHAADTAKDPITGLLNRRAALRRLSADLLRSQRDEQPMTVVALELADLTELSSQFGSERVDALVRESAQTISQQLRGSDWVAQLGSHEFILGLWGVTPDEAGIAVQRVENALKSMQGMQLSVYLGMVAAERDRGPDATVADAMSALYQQRSRA